MNKICSFLSLENSVYIPRLIVTVVFSAISMVASFVAAILNRLDTYYLDYNYDDLCPLPLSNYYYCV